MSVPRTRIRALNEAPVRPGGDHVLYWMVAHRRVHFNFALDRAVELARELGKPLLILEALRVDYPWASERFHRFVMDGMRDNRSACRATPVHHHAHFEPHPGASKGMLSDFAGRACAVVTDDFPAFFLPKMLEAAGRKLTVHSEAVDSNGLFPMRATQRVFARAVDFRRFLQKSLRPHLTEWPRARPLSVSGLVPFERLPTDLFERWPDAFGDGGHFDLSKLPIDQAVRSVEGVAGGRSAALDRWKRFLSERLTRYGDGRNDPDDEVSSCLSPHLHWGHLSVHEMFRDLASTEDWDTSCLSSRANGKREGWWGMSAGAESFLDELITWRELGFNMASLRDDHTEYASLPEWAQRTLAEHADDPREYVYDLETFERAETHDELWNAAQRQLVREGRIHNYLRMLWGKKVLEWSPSPQTALEVMVELNNKYALDGRDPNSYSGIFWVLGRYDRAWGPERPIFGKIRYMTSESTRRKVKLAQYLRRFGPSPGPLAQSGPRPGPLAE